MVVVQYSYSYEKINSADVHPPLLYICPDLLSCNPPRPPFLYPSDTHGKYLVAAVGGGRGGGGGRMAVHGDGNFTAVMAVAVAVADVAVAAWRHGGGRGGGGMAVVQSWVVFRSSVLAGGWVYWGCHGVDVGSRRTLSFHVLSASLLR